MPRYSLKKTFLSEAKQTNEQLISEGFFTDLITALAAGGSIKDMIANKLRQIGEKAKGVETAQALELVQKFRKLGLNSVGGEDLDKVEAGLKRFAKKKEKKKVDVDKLSSLLMGESTSTVSENKTHNKTSLKAVFFDD